ncbi:MAG: hypothetical protein HEQ26_10900 [Dolichospermum sp. DL01]|nr:MAG: hypothetical protein HEQ26_10900 [Dolichospermum sp. DL01]
MKRILTEFSYLNKTLHLFNKRLGVTESPSQESGVRSQELGVRSQESGVRNQESGIRMKN